MKASSLSFLFIFLFVSCAIAQQNGTPFLPIDESTNRITYTDVVFVDSSLNKYELYSIGREWFAKTYNSSMDVIQMDDKENGKIVGKALMQVYHKAMGSNYPSGHINYTISLYFRDGRFKYEVTNFYHTGQLVSGGNRISDYGPCEEMINTTKKLMGLSYQKTFDYYLSQMDDNIKLLINDLTVTMKTKPIIKQEDDW